MGCASLSHADIALTDQSQQCRALRQSPGQHRSMTDTTTVGSATIGTPDETAMRPTAELAAMPVHPAAALFPVLADIELAGLADDIREHGVRVPVVVLDGELLDGRNRVAAALSAGVAAVPVVGYTGDNPWALVVSHNVARRHLTTGQRAALGAALIEPLRGEAARRRARKPVSVRLDPATQNGRARDIAGRLTGVSGQAVGEYMRLADRHPDLAEKVAAGRLPLDRASRICRDRLSVERQQTTAATTAAGAVRCGVRHGDLRDETVLDDIEPGEVSAIVADPLWDRRGIEMARGIASLARRLRPRAMAIQTGLCHLPEMLSALSGCGLPYRWCLAVVSTQSGGTSMLGRRVTSHHTVILLYGQPGRHLPTDVLHPGAPKDPAHPYAQDVGVYETLVGALTEPGDLVLDPCAGSGTTLLAAGRLGRDSIGVDVDASMVELAQRRLGLALTD